MYTIRQETTVLTAFLYQLNRQAFTVFRMLATLLPSNNSSHSNNNRVLLTVPPIDSYSAPLLTVADHTASGSNTNAVTATLDGTILANLSNLDAAAILKHCPYHEAILKAAKLGERIPSDLASSYVASLSSLGTTLSKNQQTLISPQNSFNTPAAGSESVSYNSKDLATASHTLVQTILPSNEIQNEKSEKTSIQKGKSIKDESGKHSYKQDGLQQQILQTSEKIRNLSEETKQLQQKIVSTSQSLSQVNGQINQFDRKRKAKVHIRSKYSHPLTTTGKERNRRSLTSNCSLKVSYKAYCKRLNIHLKSRDK